MTKDMVDEVVVVFAAAARRCVGAGIDGIEVHAAHGYLWGQFLSPATNHRTDSHGGPLEHRMRLLEQVLAAARDAVSTGVPIGVRVSPTTARPTVCVRPGSRPWRHVSRRRGLIDFLDVSLGSYNAYSKIVGAMHEPSGYELASAEPVKAAVDMPTVVWGRMMEVAERRPPDP